MVNLMDLNVPETGESFLALAKHEGLTIEAIVSSDRPEPTLYDQAFDEAVLLITGGATLWIGGETVVMKPGDFLLIPAHTPHKVLHTRSGTRWLAIHSEHPLKAPSC